MVREAKKEDLAALPELYLFLHEDSIPAKQRAKWTCLRRSVRLLKVRAYNEMDHTDERNWIIERNYHNKAQKENMIKIH